MQSLILFDDDNWKGLLPLTFTKPICELRVGILTIREKWEKYLRLQASHITQDFLSEKYPFNIEDDNLIINSTILPTVELVAMVKDLNTDEALLAGDELLAARLGKDQLLRLTEDVPINELIGKDIQDQKGLYKQVLRPYDIFTFNGEEINKDYHLITDNKTSAIISDTNRVANFDNIFLEEGAEVEFAILNASEGPIYIGRNAKILEGAIIRGPFALGDHSVRWVPHSNSTIGPYCKAGGEINNSILFGYSNKGHEGYMGNSVIGEWCNIGADTNTSNLKNDYEEVKVWNYASESFEKSGLQFCGLIMGDHSKCGINTMFNTGTVVGANTNIFGSGYPGNYIPSFAYGGSKGYTTYQMDKALETFKRVHDRKNKPLLDEDTKILKHIFYYSAKWRTWEK